MNKKILLNLSVIGGIISTSIVASCQQEVKYKITSVEVNKDNDSYILSITLDQKISEVEIVLDSNQKFKSKLLKDSNTLTFIIPNDLKPGRHEFDLFDSKSNKKIEILSNNNYFLIENTKQEEPKPTPQPEPAPAPAPKPGEGGNNDDPIQPEPEPNPVPQPPVFPPNFPDFSELNKQLHRYPQWADKFTKISEQQAYEEIHKRSFAIKFGVDFNENQFITSSSGTGWLLDYHKASEDKYKLFIATNLHVISDLSNTLSDELNTELNYKDTRDANYRATAISIGKAANVNNNFESKNNNFRYQDDQDNKVHYLTNDSRFANQSASDFEALNTTKIAGLSSPKIVFAGYDFIDKSYINPIQDEVKQQIRERINYLENNESNIDPSDDHAEINILKRTLKNNDFVPFYTDFAVFEIDVDFSLMSEQNAKFFKDAINGLDTYLDRLNRTEVLPNQDKSVSNYMLTADYITSYIQKGQNQNNLWNSQNVYIGGYPANPDHRSAFWSRNNPLERNSTENWYNREPKNAQAFGLPANRFEEKVTNNNYTPYTKVFGKTLLHYYGFSMSILFSSLYYGASGSLVYNDFGQMIGVYSSVSSSLEYGDLSKNAGFTPLLLSKDYAVGEKAIKAYNLIDGTNKNLYPAQTRSYRDNLRTIYKNGFDNGSKTTALFKNGF
ncbi:MIP family Ig-specific serine endopeptidase [Mycoplasma simbae]|uniref:MIP family Ig-specific serine endopeptidase n=1 Tax=Mycoplasma simbae TaxID=36744 RepID=UPI00068CD49B|nr:DUF31 family protein [Mycoplasma simbae]